MRSAAVLLPTAFELLSAVEAAAFQRSEFQQRSPEAASVAASGSDVTNPELLMVITGFETNCTGAPFTVGIISDGECQPSVDECVFNYVDDNGNPTSNVTSRVECKTGLESTIDGLFGDVPYLRQDQFVDETCTTWTATTVRVADGKCHEQFERTESGEKVGLVAVVNANSSATVTSFVGGDCSGDIITSTLIDQQQLSSSACVGMVRAYTNAEASTNTEGSGNGGMRSAGGASSQFAIASVAILALALSFVQ